MRLQRFFPLALILVVMGINVSIYSRVNASAATPIPGSTQRLGQLFVAQGDPGPGQHLQHQTAYSLKDAKGHVTRLTFSANSPLPPITANGKWLNVTGNILAALQSNAEAQGSKTELLQVQSYQFATAPAGAEVAGAPSQQSAVSGSQAWVNIMCRFADEANTSRDTTYVNALMGKMNHYWNEQSYGLVNLSGTQVYGWFDLPLPRSAYFVGSSFDLDKAAQDCTGAADSAVYFPNFVGVNLMFNDVLDCCAWGGGDSLNWDGVSRIYHVTWLPPWGYENQGVVAHEMGHGFGLPHSSGPYGQTYDSGWDVMSNLWFSCPPYDADFGCIAVGTISEHKNMLDWIAPERKYTVNVGTSGTISLERLDLPISTTNYLMAIVPINGSSSHFYTVEARKFSGYDSKLPYEAVVIHDVDLSGAHLNPANVVDGDNNGITTDEGSAWTVGETYTDTTNSIQIQVVGSDTSSFTVKVSNGNLSTPVPTFAPPTNTPVGPTATPPINDPNVLYLLNQPSSLSLDAGLGAASDTVASAGGSNYDGAAHLPQTYTISGINGTFNGSNATAFNLYVDAGTNIGTGIQARISYDFNGDGAYDRIETYNYFAMNPIVDWELYSNTNRTLEFSSGTYANLNNGSIRVEVWNAIGNAPTSLRVNATSANGQQSLITIPFTNITQGNGTSTPTPTFQPPTNTPISPTATPTFQPPTNTPISPTATPTSQPPTNTPISPTATPTTSTTVSAYTQIKASTFASKVGGTLETTTDIGGGQDVAQFANGNNIGFANVDFGTTGPISVTARVASGASGGDGGLVEFWVDGTSTATGGTKLGDFGMSSTGGWQTWQSIPGNVAAITGVHTVYIVFNSGQPNPYASVNWIQFNH